MNAQNARQDLYWKRTSVSHPRKIRTARSLTTLANASTVQRASPTPPKLKDALTALLTASLARKPINA